MTPAEIRRLFAAFLANPTPEIDLAEAALVIAQTAYPDLDREIHMMRIGDMAAEVRQRVGDERDPYTIANIISEYLFDVIGLQGNAADYYDPRNSFINDVLDRKVGIPITLSVVYIEVARRLGLSGFSVDGAGMPGHFLVRLRSTAADDGEEGSVLIDPFHRGVILESADVAQIAAAVGVGATTGLPSEIAPRVSNREILARMLNNLKAIYLDRQDLPRCLEIVELALRIEPQHAADLRLASELRRLLAQ